MLPRIESELGRAASGAVALAFLATVTFAYSPICAAEGNNVENVMWGINGHNDKTDFDQTYSYHRVSLAEQLGLLRQAGLVGYRTGCLYTTCDQLLKEAQKSGITLLRLISRWPDPTVSEAVNYERAYAHAYAEALRYRGKFKYYEASNELDNWVGMNGNGDTREQYKEDRYVRARGFIKGLIAGVHMADPSAMVLVDNAGWCHYGFLKMLWEDGVLWDITAVHWYATMGDIERVGCGGGANVASIHASFGKPIWITELNSNTAADANDPEAAGKWITDFITRIERIAPKYNIKAGFIYELLDEQVQSAGEGHYGIADSWGKPKKTLFNIAEKLKASPPAQ